MFLSSASGVSSCVGYAGLVWALVGRADVKAGWAIGTTATLTYRAFMVKRLGWRSLAQFVLIGSAFIVRGTYGTFSHGGILDSHRLPVFLLVLGSAIVVTAIIVWLVAHRGRIIADIKGPFHKARGYIGGKDIEA